MFTLTLILIALNCYILYITRLPPNLIAAKRRYTALREHLRRTDTFPSLWREKPLTGFYKRRGTNVGYNSNKGDDISVCLDGDVNSMMHVLIHELAHCTVPEYDHSERFWANNNRLAKIASDIGIYDEISLPTEFCGKEIGDK